VGRTGRTIIRISVPVDQLRERIQTRQGPLKPDVQFSKKKPVDLPGIPSDETTGGRTQPHSPSTPLAIEASPAITTPPLPAQDSPPDLTPIALPIVTSLPLAPSPVAPQATLTPSVTTITPPSSATHPIIHVPNSAYPRPFLSSARLPQPATASNPAKTQYQLAQLESTLYRRQYPNDAVEARLERLEKTARFAQGRTGSVTPDQRIFLLYQYAHHQYPNSFRPIDGHKMLMSPLISTDERLLQYMESRLLGKSQQKNGLDVSPPTDRIAALEFALFGEVDISGQQTLPQRLKRLSLQLPIQPSDIQLRAVEDGQPLARTQFQETSAP